MRPRKNMGEHPRCEPESITFCAEACEKCGHCSYCCDCDRERELTAEDLIDDYINGNLGKVREKLEQAPPMVAAIVAVDLYRMIVSTGTPGKPSAAVFLDRLRAWQP